MPRTYAESGVDVELEARAISSLLRSLEETGPKVGLLPGHFTGLIEFGDYALSLCTDGVGTKVILARTLGRLDTIGIDCIAMNVNDMICAGARPIAFVDYLAMERPTPEEMSAIGRGLARGAEEAGVLVIGGETATLPEIINGLDLAGTCLGCVRKDRIVTGDRVTEGDAIVGIASSGPHSNGYTLIRKVLDGRLGEPFGDRTLGEALLEPTSIYVRSVLDLLDRFDVHGLAHITGGGLRNITRVNPGFRYRIDDPLPVPEIFDIIQRAGDIVRAEMYRTFNMGTGFTVILPARSAKEAVRILSRRFPARVIGTVVAGDGVEIVPEGITLPPYS